MRLHKGNKVKKGADKNLNELIKINNRDITIKEFNGKRVITFKDIDAVHERPEGTAKRNFVENKPRFIEDIDYFEVSPKIVPTFEEYGFSKFAPNGILITESGYMMLVKSFTDDLAWTVQRELVNGYFRSRRLSKKEEMKLYLEVLEEQDAKIEAVNKDLQEFKLDIPLLGIECEQISNAVRKKGVKCLGGKDSSAYKDRSLRGKLYSDIYSQLKREFAVTSYKAIKRSQVQIALEIINNYKAPYALNTEIEQCNKQIKINDKTA